MNALGEREERVSECSGSESKALRAGALVVPSDCVGKGGGSADLEVYLAM